jgi:glucan-binding YG repeat protein
MVNYYLENIYLFYDIENIKKNTKFHQNTLYQYLTNEYNDEILEILVHLFSPQERPSQSTIQSKDTNESIQKNSRIKNAISENERSENERNERSENERKIKNVLKNLKLSNDFKDYLEISSE